MSVQRKHHNIALFHSFCQSSGRKFSRIFFFCFLCLTKWDMKDRYSHLLSAFWEPWRSTLLPLCFFFYHTRAHKQKNTHKTHTFTHATIRRQSKQSRFTRIVCGKKIFFIIFCLRQDKTEWKHQTAFLNDLFCCFFSFCFSSFHWFLVDVGDILMHSPTMHALY